MDKSSSKVLKQLIRLLRAAPQVPTTMIRPSTALEKEMQRSPARRPLQPLQIVNDAPQQQPGQQQQQDSPGAPEPSKRRLF